MRIIDWSSDVCSSDLKAMIARQTMSRRQPRPIGRMRPSSRVPPSSIDAITMPAKISRIGWTRIIQAPTSSARPNQTLALASSVRTSWVRISVGPGASSPALARAFACSLFSTIASLPVRTSVTRGPQIGSRAVAAQRAQPAQRIIPLDTAVGRKADELGAAGDGVEGDGAAEALGPDGDAAVGARSEEHTSELQSLMRTSYAVFC